MIGRIVEWSLSNRLVVVIAVLVLIVAGGRGYANLSVDAVPDITNVQVQVLTKAPGLSPLEMEQLVTRPIELSMAGLPGLEMVRSVSRAGVSAVTLVFRDDMTLADARSLASQRLPAARDVIPPGANRPELGPLTTGLGEVYHFTVAWDGHNARDVRTLFDWEVAYSLRSVPGVVEVNAWGGETRQVEVRLRPTDMLALGVTQRDVEAALGAAGKNAGAGALDRGEEQILVRLDGQYRSVEQIADQVVRTRAGGVAVSVRDIATVRDGAAFRTAVATADGKGETVYGMVQMVAAGNAHEVMTGVRQRIAEIQTRLPEGARIEPFYDRTSLVDRVLGTVRRSLVEGGVIVVLVLLALFGDVAAGLVVATAIPLAMLGAFAAMYAFGISGNLMSLGAIDFGLVVDGAVVVVEGALAAMTTLKMSSRDALAHEGRAVGGPIAFGVLIIALVYVPILMLEGVEGKMFRPMAVTVLFALGTALVLTFTWVPVLASLVLRKAHEKEAWIIRHVRAAYTPALAWTVRRPIVAALFAGVLVAAGAIAAASRGAEFVPRLEEGDLAIMVTRPPSVSLREAAEGTSTMERVLGAYPEVRRVVSRTGSPDVATDIMGIEQSDVFVMLRPPDEWKSAHSREGLIVLFERDLRKALPGTVFAFSQPIEMRSQELLGGMRSDLGIKIVGDDLTELTQLAHEVAGEVRQVRGVADVRVEPTTGLPLATIRPSPARMGRIGVRPDDVRIAVEALRAGRTVGTLVQGERRFDVTVKLDAPPSPDLESLRRQPLLLPDGRYVPLGDVCDVELSEGPAQVSREHGRRRVMVEMNVRNRDLASFVQEVSARLREKRLPPGYFFVYAGQYENLARASLRLALIVPATLFAIFTMLYLTFRRIQPAVLIFCNIPAAAAGGIVALACRGMPMSISATVGLVALFGVSVLNGVVLLSAALRHEDAGAQPLVAARAAAGERLRPVLTTAVVASLGFLPMAMATGTGAEVQRPLATVVMGGLAADPWLTLFVLPTFYAWMRRIARRWHPGHAGGARHG